MDARSHPAGWRWPKGRQFGPALKRNSSEAPTRGNRRQFPRFEGKERADFQRPESCGKGVRAEELVSLPRRLRCSAQTGIQDAKSQLAISVERPRLLWREPFGLQPVWPLMAITRAQGSRVAAAWLRSMPGIFGMSRASAPATKPKTIRLRESTTKPGFASLAFGRKLKWNVRFKKSASQADRMRTFGSSAWRPAT